MSDAKHVPTGADDLRQKDAEALLRYQGVRSAHTYQASWYNNATFVFPCSR